MLTFLSLVAGAVLRDTSGDEAQFEAFKVQFRKQYSNTEDNLRFITFRENLDYIAESNSRNLPYILGVGPFADLTEQEFLDRHTSQVSGPPTYDNFYLGEHNATEVASPVASVDWVKQGKVTAIKNQKGCGGEREGVHM